MTRAGLVTLGVALTIAGCYQPRDVPTCGITGSCLDAGGDDGDGPAAGDGSAIDGGVTVDAPPPPVCTLPLSFTTSVQLTMNEPVVYATVVGAVALLDKGNGVIEYLSPLDTAVIPTTIENYVGKDLSHPVLRPDGAKIYLFDSPNNVIAESVPAGGDASAWTSPSAVNLDRLPGPPGVVSNQLHMVTVHTATSLDEWVLDPATNTWMFSQTYTLPNPAGDETFSDPALSADGQVLVFANGGNKAGIYVAARDSNGTFTLSVDPAQRRLPGRLSSPTLSADCQTLYVVRSGQLESNR